MSNHLLLLAGCVPPALLLGAALFERHQRQRCGERPPQHEKLLRPAGHSLSQRLADLGDQALMWMMGSFLASLAAVGFISTTSQSKVGEAIGTPIVFGPVVVVCTVMAYRKLRAIRTTRLGLLGEQSIAEQLQQLPPPEFRVFHDIPGDGKWNVDHIVVGPTGVFAIETKARTKKPGKQGRAAHEAVYDGKAIQFPHFMETDALEQARNCTRWATNWLSKATGTRVSVIAVVALPGWWVTQKTNPKQSDVKVLSGKQTPNFILNGQRILSAEAIQQISYQVEQRCRDIEF